MSNPICSCVDVLGIRGASASIDFSGVESMTRQSCAKDADINNIMKRYPNGGFPVDLSGTQPVFGDFSDIADFAHLVNRVAEARESFMALPADLRARFNNDVQELLAFVQLPENVAEAVNMKLLPESMLEATYLVRPDLRPELKAPEPEATGGQGA